MLSCCFPLPHLFLLKARYRCQAVFSQINDRLSASGGSCTTKCQLSQTCNVTWPGARNSPVPVPAGEPRVYRIPSLRSGISRFHNSPKLLSWAAELRTGSLGRLSGNNGFLGRVSTV